MSFHALKDSMEKIRMPAEMQDRIIRNCREHEKEEKEMRKVRFGLKKVLSVAVAATLCICLSAAMVAAAGQGGIFKDVLDWTGAVVGTTYEQATEEMELWAEMGEDALTITVHLLTAEKAPYREIEILGIGKYRIEDLSGNVITEGEGADGAKIVDGTVQLQLSSAGLENEKYKLMVKSFVGLSKADQPLEICGTWECAFEAK